jgi:pSer/pThr/pTyr-binding forkhead associated (FHA) protein
VKSEGTIFFCSLVLWAIFERRRQFNNLRGERKNQKEEQSANKNLTEAEVKKKMPFYGSIVVIRRSGVDGSIFPLVSSECLLGRAEGCDIRVQLPTVSREHCRISVNQNEQVSSRA